MIAYPATFPNAVPPSSIHGSYSVSAAPPVMCYSSTFTNTQYVVHQTWQYPPHLPQGMHGTIVRCGSPSEIAGQVHMQYACAPPAYGSFTYPEVRYMSL